MICSPGLLFLVHLSSPIEKIVPDEFLVPKISVEASLYFRDRERYLLFLGRKNGLNNGRHGSNALKSIFKKTFPAHLEYSSEHPKATIIKYPLYPFGSTQSSIKAKRPKLHPPS